MTLIDPHADVVMALSTRPGFADLHRYLTGMLSDHVEAEIRGGHHVACLGVARTDRAVSGCAEELIAQAYEFATENYQSSLFYAGDGSPFDAGQIHEFDLLLRGDGPYLGYNYYGLVQQHHTSEVARQIRMALAA
jgi:hypothetical protein